MAPQKFWSSMYPEIESMNSISSRFRVFLFFVSNARRNLDNSNAPSSSSKCSYIHPASFVKSFICSSPFTSQGDVFLYLVRLDALDRDLLSMAPSHGSCARNICRCMNSFRCLRKADAFLCSARPDVADRNLQPTFWDPWIFSRNSCNSNLPCSFPSTFVFFYLSASELMQKKEHVSIPVPIEGTCKPGRTQREDTCSNI